MSFTLELTDSYGLVLAVATSTFFINTLHSVLTVQARKASGLKYPIAYATAEQADKDPAAYKFNCAQRGHANFTENHTPFLGALLISGLRYPVVAAALGAGWAVSRVAYAYGYISSSGPQGRVSGVIGATVSDFALKVLAAYTSFAIATGQ